MISLLVDECYAFDYLSILEVKKDKNPQHEPAWEECRVFLKNQLPEDFDQVINSEEYKNLYDANLKTFDAVAKARSEEPITAKEVDNCNMLRYNCKVALQSKFFSNSSIREVKLS